MENVLIVSSNANASESMTGFLKESFGCNVRTAETGGYARSIVSGNPSWEIVIINTPLSDENGMELAEYITDVTAASCMMLVKAENAGAVSDRADKSDIIVISKPFSRNILYQIIKAVDSAMKRSWSLYEETVRLERKIDEIKLIDKAKFMLMQYKGMTEDEAHSYLEQYAMKNRRKKTIAANEIIEKISEKYI